MTGSIKVLGFHFSYNKDLVIEKNFSTVLKKIIDTLRIWKMRNLTIQGKITIFKTLAISKIIYVAFIAPIPSVLMKELIQIHKEFIWDSKTPKIKHTTLIGDINLGGLRDVDISSKFRSLQLSWLSRYFNDNFHSWKKIAKHYFGKIGNSLFFPNSSISHAPKDIPKFYSSLIELWHSISQQEPITSSSILSECIWFNTRISIDNNPITPKLFKNNITINLFVSDLFDHNGSPLSWDIFRGTHNLADSFRFQWQQCFHSIPRSYKNSIQSDLGRSRVFCEFNPHLLNKAKIVPINKLSAKYFYIMDINSIFEEPTSQKTLINRLGCENLPWKDIYLLPRKLTTDTYSRVFQFKCSHNILYLNNRLYKFGFAHSPLCSFCNLNNETIVHLFSECKISISLWQQLKNHFLYKIPLPDLDPQSAFFGFLEGNFLQNNILLIFKLALYRYRKNAAISLAHVLKGIKQREMHERIHASNTGKINHHNTKWLPLLEE